ncbi:FGGY-family carbohydrate kinase [Rhizobium paknamense]|uniref:Sugar (Pentulose or hexulose) kinase n=1 Tax=Rhizobium paknamense TaxID=1206817 RepID=A0ABU0IIA5_9HYPH|nr:FGGY-family carbohydrate kinase [Rhizobium paknamense]MDQ0457916.1 sugar (pentulose or hexulose) kinase [Rhizobium paknamense]
MTGVSSDLVIGLDMGTSGARAVAMNPDGVVLATGARRLADVSEDHRSPEAWWTVIGSALRQVLDQVDRERVRALAIDGTSGTILAVDASGTVLTTPMMYNDPVKDEAILYRIAAHAPPDSAAHGATSGLAKALVLQVLPDVAHILHQADWLAGRFSGRFDLTDENNALKTGYDPVARQWPDWMEKTGLHRHLLPKVLAAGEPMGVISAEVGRVFGLPEDVLVIAGTTDGCASFLATGASHLGDGVTALGSTLTVKMLCDRPLFAPEYGIYSHRIGNMWLAGGASNSGGAVLAAHFTAEQMAALSARIDPAQESGLDFYPLSKPGERFPLNDPSLQPRMTPRPERDEDFLHALLEGIANIEKLAYGRLEALGAPPLAGLYSVGGGAQNRVWSAIRQNKLQVPFLSACSEEAAAGTARLALKGAGLGGLS